MKYKSFIALILIALLLVGCNVSQLGTENIEVDEAMVHQIAQLPTLNLNTINTFETYQFFADGLNALIRILNEKMKSDIPFLDKSQETWGKISNKMTKYLPLIKRYNTVIMSAQELDKEKSNKDKKKRFYVASGTFGLEVVLVVSSVLAITSYQAVGVAYRASGLNQLALKCASCVREILSQANFMVRTGILWVGDVASNQIIDKIYEDFNSENK